MFQGYIKEAAYQFSLPAWEVLHILCASRASSWSLRGHWWFLRRFLVVLIYWMPQGYIKEATCQFSDLYPPGKFSHSWVLQSRVAEFFLLSDTAFFTTDLSNIERMSKTRQKGIILIILPIFKTHVRQIIIGQCVQ